MGEAAGWAAALVTKEVVAGGWRRAASGVALQRATLRNGPLSGAERFWRWSGRGLCCDDADLLIVGTHGRRGFDRVLLGSVAEQLVRRAGCPVLVARPRNYLGLTKTALPDAPYAPGQAAPRAQGEAREPVTSTTIEGWNASDSGPTGFRTV